MAVTNKTTFQTRISSSDVQVSLSILVLCVVLANLAFFFSQLNEFRIGNTDFKMFYAGCLAPDFLDTELSVFMPQLRVQGAAGEPGLA